MNIDDYLKRIKCQNCKEINVENLKKLQQQHFREICYENTDIHLKEKIHIDLSIEKAYKRVMYESRGGWCYELNPLFYWLLKKLGYDVIMVACWPYQAYRNDFSHEIGHSFCVVKLNECNYYVDVGTPRIVDEPIEIKTDIIIRKQFGTYRFTKDSQTSNCYLFYRTKSSDNSSVIEESDWNLQFKFNIEHYEISEEANDYPQSELAPLSKISLIGKHINNGLIGLHGNTFIQMNFDPVTFVASKTTEQLTDQQVKQYIKEKFNLKIDDSFIPRSDAVIESLKTN
jgi:arylamine N-acetyltransferase